MRKKKTGEGSAADKRQDAAGMKATGLSAKAYEKSPQDRAADRKRDGGDMSFSEAIAASRKKRGK